MRRVEARPAVHGQDLPGARLLEQRAHVRVGRQPGPVGLHLRQVLVHRPVQPVHHGHVERGHDLQAAAVDLLLGEAVGVLKLVLHGLHDVAPEPGEAGEQRIVRLHLREHLRVGLGLGQVAIPDHVVEHVMPARHQGRVAIPGTRVRAEESRLVDHGGEHGGLRDVELQGGHAEVGLRRRGDAVGVVAERHRVQVLGHDPGLGLLMRELDRDEDLLDLRADRPRGADRRVVVLGELLGERGPALQGAAALDVRVRGAQDAGDRDAALVVKVPVLRRDHRVLHDGRDLGIGQHLPVDAVGAERSHLVLAVGEVDDRRLLQGRFGDIGGNRGPRVGVHDARHDEEDQPGDRARGDHHGLLQGPVPPPAALAARGRPAVPAATGPAAIGVTAAPAGAANPGARAVGEAGGALAQSRSPALTAGAPVAEGIAIPVAAVGVIAVTAAAHGPPGTLVRRAAHPEP